jgi:hypothetical protein
VTMAKDRNPKPEIRKKSEGRSPKGGQFSDSSRNFRLVLLTRARLSEAEPSSVARPTEIGCPLWRYCGEWTGSDFRFRASFGFRVSAFGFPSCPIPLKTKRTTKVSEPRVFGHWTAQALTTRIMPPVEQFPIARFSCAVFLGPLPEFGGYARG